MLLLLTVLVLQLLKILFANGISAAVNNVAFVSALCGIFLFQQEIVHIIFVKFTFCNIYVSPLLLRKEPLEVSMAHIYNKKTNSTQQQQSGDYGGHAEDHQRNCQRPPVAQGVSLHTQS